MSRARLVDAQAPRRVDAALAALLQRLDPAGDPRVAQAAQAAMHAVALGEAALDLRTLADGGELASLHAALQASRWVATPGIDDAAAPDVPLVLEGDLLYLRRYREYERRLALGLRRIARKTVDTHLNRINHKLGLRNLAELVRLAANLGMIDSGRQVEPEPGAAPLPTPR